MSIGIGIVINIKICFLPISGPDEHESAVFRYHKLVVCVCCTALTVGRDNNHNHLHICIHWFQLFQIKISIIFIWTFEVSSDLCYWALIGTYQIRIDIWLEPEVSNSPKHLIINTRLLLKIAINRESSSYRCMIFYPPLRILSVAIALMSESIASFSCLSIVHFFTFFCVRVESESGIDFGLFFFFFVHLLGNKLSHWNMLCTHYALNHLATFTTRFLHV